MDYVVSFYHLSAIYKKLSIFKSYIINISKINTEDKNDTVIFSPLPITLVV